MISQDIVLTKAKRLGLTVWIADPYIYVRRHGNAMYWARSWERLAKQMERAA
jgi:hypothetical protein